MKIEMVEINRKPEVGFLVTVKITPGWFSKLLGAGIITRKLYSKYTNMWYDADTLEEVSYINDTALRRFLDEHINEARNEVIRALERFKTDK
jgi:hypothetical protein